MYHGIIARRTVLWVLFSTFVAVSNGAAQTPAPASPSGGQENSLRDGAWALEFSVEGFFSRAGVRLKRHFSAKDALTLSVVGGGSSSDWDRLNPDTTTTTSEDDDYSVRTEVVYQRYVNPTAPANVYWGIGPFVDFSHRGYAFTTEQSRQVDDVDMLEVGLVALVGAEWFASESFSLHLEYTANLGYETFDRDLTYSPPAGADERTTEESSGWSANFGRFVRFGVGMYF